MKVSQFVRSAGLIAVVTIATVGASAGSAVAQDGRHIAAGILSGIANGLSGQPANGGQFYPSYPQYPQGALVQPGINGTDIIMQSRLQPGANIAIPGTMQQFGNAQAGGVQYLGADGRLHGNVVVNNADGTQTRTFFRGAPSSTMRPISRGQGGHSHHRGYR